MLSKLCNDVRYGLRSLRRNPGFAAAAIVTIALGVGVNTGIFSVLNGLLFRDLPVPQGNELVSVHQTLEGVPDREGALAFDLFSTSEYRTFRDQSRTLPDLMGFAGPWDAEIGGQRPQEVVGMLVTCNYLDVLRQPPAIGRGVTASDCDAGADAVVVLGHDLWLTRYEADPAIVGRTVVLNRQLFTVIGVAAEDTYNAMFFRSEFFAPISTEPILQPEGNAYDDDNYSWLTLIGRRDAASLDQVRAELGVIAARIDRQQPGRSTQLSVARATPITTPIYRTGSLAGGVVLMIAFGFVLLIACANVANLLLARSTARTREIAVRASLGASRARLIRQLLTESVLISIAGGSLGALLALWSFESLLATAVSALAGPGFPPLAVDLTVDIRVVSLTLALLVGTGILFGLAPALQVSRSDLQALIKQDTSGAGSSRRGGRLRGTLIGVQVGLSMVLMIAAGLLLRGLYSTHTAEPGFAYEDVAYARYDLADAGYDAAGAAAFERQLIERVGALPDVEAAAFAEQEPLSAMRMFSGPEPVRLPGQDESDYRLAELNRVTAEYFSLLEIPVQQGRTFTETELADEATVAIVSATTARNLWPDRSPIGQTLLHGEEELRVVGVVGNAQVTSLGRIDPHVVYLPAGPAYWNVLLVRSRADFATTAAGIRSAVQALDPGIPVSVRSMDTNLAWWQDLSSVVTWLGTALGALALVLASVGIYGVASYFVSSRIREIGIRVALGATRGNVLGLTLRKTMRPVVVGGVIGLAAAVAVSGILSGVLFGVSPFDPIGMGGAALLVVGVALAAGVVATRRATQDDPSATLRYE